MSKLSGLVTYIYYFLFSNVGDTGCSFWNHCGVGEPRQTSSDMLTAYSVDVRVVVHLKKNKQNTTWSRSQGQGPPYIL